MSKFNISNFENAFYTMLYANHALDTPEFNRKICYHGHVLRVTMHNFKIVSIVDLSGVHPVLLYSLKAKAA